MKLLAVLSYLVVLLPYLAAEPPLLPRLLRFEEPTEPLAVAEDALSLTSVLLACLGVFVPAWIGTSLPSFSKEGGGGVLNYLWFEMF